MMITRHGKRASAFLSLFLMTWAGLCIDVANSDRPLSRFTPKLQKVPRPPLFSKGKNNKETNNEDTVTISSRDLDIAAPIATTDVTATVSKSILLTYLTRIQQTMVDFVSGSFTWKEAMYLLLAIASIGLSCSAMIIEASLLVDILAWTCIIVGPSAAILQRKVSLLEGMRALTNQLRAEVNEMTASNTALQSQNRRLSKNALKLKNTQAALEELSASQGISVDKLVSQVNEYKQIQQDIKTDLRSKVQQTLLSVFMRSDKDEDFIIDPEEVSRLIFRLKSIPAVEFDEDKFRKALDKEGGDIMKFADKYFGHNAPLERDGIFKF